MKILNSQNNNFYSQLDKIINKRKQINNNVTDEIQNTE